MASNGRDEIEAPNLSMGALVDRLRGRYFSVEIFTDSCDIDLLVSIRIVKEKLGHFLDIGVCYNGDWEIFFCKQFETIGPLWSDMFEIKKKYFIFKLY